MGLAHDKIVFFGMKYIEKGYITKDEYDDLIRYFYEPYMAIGGDGTAEQIMRIVQQLPLILDHTRISDITDKLEKGAGSVQKKLKEGENFGRNE